MGFIVHDRVREDRFFRTVLGFRPYWFGGNEDSTPTWISQQVPDGSDWLEYMIVGTVDGRGIPKGMSQSLLGVFNHFSLGVANMQDCVHAAVEGRAPVGSGQHPQDRPRREVAAEISTIPTARAPNSWNCMPSANRAARRLRHPIRHTDRLRIRLREEPST